MASWGQVLKEAATWVLAVGGKGYGSQNGRVGDLIRSAMNEAPSDEVRGVLVVLNREFRAGVGAGDGEGTSWMLWAAWVCVLVSPSSELPSHALLCEFEGAVKAMMGHVAKESWKMGLERGGLEEIKKVVESGVKTRLSGEHVSAIVSAVIDGLSHVLSGKNMLQELKGSRQGGGGELRRVLQAGVKVRLEEGSLLYEACAVSWQGRGDSGGVVLIRGWDQDEMMSCRSGVIGGLSALAGWLEGAGVVVGGVKGWTALAGSVVETQMVQDALGVLVKNTGGDSSEGEGTAAGDDVVEGCRGVLTGLQLSWTIASLVLQASSQVLFPPLPVSARTTKTLIEEGEQRLPPQVGKRHGARGGGVPGWGGALGGWGDEERAREGGVAARELGIDQV